MKRNPIPVVLSIAGSDSSGGAGIQADIRTCTCLGVYCTTVITAVTAQNPRGVLDISECNNIDRQLDAVLSEMRPDAVKIGMLPSVGAVKAVYDAIIRYGLTNIVIDPVMSATSGKSLTGCNAREVSDTVSATTNLLFPLATLITPNIPELLHMPGVDSQGSTAAAACALMQNYGVRTILVKGGHDTSGICTDILMSQECGELSFSSPRIQTEHTHGTGCTLSSAIAANLAIGHPLNDAVKLAKDFINKAIETATRFPMAETNGPVIQFVPTSFAE